MGLMLMVWGLHFGCNNWEGRGVRNSEMFFREKGAETRERSLYYKSCIGNAPSDHLSAKEKTRKNTGRKETDGVFSSS